MLYSSKMKSRKSSGLSENVQKLSYSTHSKLSRFSSSTKINPFLAVLSSLRAHLKIFPLQRLCVSGVGSHVAPGHCLF